MSNSESVVGGSGRLIVGTRGPAGPGEVLVKIRGGSETFLAWSDDPLPAGTAVLVVEDRGGRAVYVQPWRSPLEPPR